jgi:hypothetical protein
MHATLRAAGFALAAVCVASCSSDNKPTGPTQNDSTMSFFVTSSKSTTGDIGGLRGADSLCQSLAHTAGVGNKTWRAYLSVERDADNGNRPTDARSRIGNGPWFNAKGVMVASNPTELHARKGDSTVFVDERGQPINGQWAGSPAPVEHDIMTGSAADGTLMAGFTCGDWTSAAPTTQGQVGHSDGLGPNGDTSGTLSSWEFGTRESELREHGAAWGRRPHLLLRRQVKGNLPHPASQRRSLRCSWH